MSVTRVDALLAQVNWMGTYEATTGQPLEDVVEKNPGLTDEEIEAQFDIPADMVAGYRLAIREYHAATREVEIRKVAAKVRAARPGWSESKVQREARALYVDAERTAAVTR